MTADDGLSAQATASVARHARTPWRGHPYPLGATWDGAGVNFAIYSENAEGVELGGDLPFMVATDSADVWSRRGDFRLDARVGVTRSHRP